uniref:Uncharacterized protein n=1 Tax=Acrobeloides nanus TaxID=290746 RepID=A0A914E2M1_9BILA
MPNYPAFIVDAFTNTKFAGNQAAVVLSEKKLSDEEYQKIAAEFNLSETAFPIPIDKPGDFKKASKFSLRWFTPTVEVVLCGHATLATSHVLFKEIGNVNDTIYYETLSGELVVKKSDILKDALTMNFPQYHEIVDLKSKEGSNIFPKETCPEFIDDILKTIAPNGYVHVSLAAKKLVIVLDSTTTREELLQVRAPADALIKAHPEGNLVRGAIVTFAPKDPAAQGFIGANNKPYDFVSRYFAPWAGIPEDPATGAAHCVLGPFWAKMLKKPGPFYAFQCYPKRGAEFHLELLPENRINLTGHATTIVRGNIEI